MRRLLCILSDSYLVGNKFKFYLEKNILKREIIKTLDGSTIQIKDWDECYHSKHGNSGKLNMYSSKMACPYLNERFL
jgi:hypothetical protein